MIFELVNFFHASHHIIRPKHIQESWFLVIWPFLENKNLWYSSGNIIQTDKKWQKNDEEISCSYFYFCSLISHNKELILRQTQNYRQVLIGQCIKNFTCMYFTYDAGLRVQYPNGILISFISLHLLWPFAICAISLKDWIPELHSLPRTVICQVFLGLPLPTNASVWNWAMPSCRGS